MIVAGWSLRDGDVIHNRCWQPTMRVMTEPKRDGQTSRTCQVYDQPFGEVRQITFCSRTKFRVVRRCS